MENIKIESKEKQPVANVGYRKGYTFDFDDDGRLISAYGSAWTGKETVSINGEVVVEKRAFTRKSTLKFTYAEDQYEIEYNMVDLCSGELHCTLIKNGVHCKTLKKALASQYQLSHKSWWQMLVLFFLGGVFGYTSLHLILKLFGE